MMHVNEDTLLSIKRSLFALMDLFPMDQDRTVHNQLWNIVQQLKSLEVGNGN